MSYRNVDKEAYKKKYANKKKSKKTSSKVDKRIVQQGRGRGIKVYS